MPTTTTSLIGAHRRQNPTMNLNSQNCQRLCTPNGQNKVQMKTFKCKLYNNSRQLSVPITLCSGGGGGGGVEVSVLFYFFKYFFVGAK